MISQQLFSFEGFNIDGPDTILLLLQMGDSGMLGLSSDSSGLERSSQRVDIMDWDFESDETDPEMIFPGLMDSDDAMSLMGQKDMYVVSDAESVVGEPTNG